MKNYCRYIVGYFVLAILLLPILAAGILQIAETRIESTRERRLETEELVTVTLPAKDVVWEEDNKELWVGDRMFDVSSYTIKDGVYHLSGVFDDDETEIAGSLLHLILSKKGNDILRMLFLLQCFTIGLLAFELNYKKARQKSLSLYLFLLPFPSYLVLVPPPRPISS